MSDTELEEGGGDQRWSPCLLCLAWPVVDKELVRSRLGSGPGG